MMRWLWRLCVPGTLYSAAAWAALASWDIFVTPRPPVAVIDMILAALNLYSWDYQRRHRAGGAS